MALSGADVAYAAAVMANLVPVHKACRLSASFIEGGKTLCRELGAVLGDGAQVISLEVLRLRRPHVAVGVGAADARACPGDHQGEGHACGLQEVLLLCDAAGFDFSFKEQAVVVAVQVPGGAAHHLAGGVAAERDHLLDPLVLGAVGKAQGAVGGEAGRAVLRRAYVAVLDLQRHVKAGVALPAHRVFAAGVVVADCVHQVAVAHGHAAIAFGGAAIVVKHVAQRARARQCLGTGVAFKRDVGQPVGPLAVVPVAAHVAFVDDVAPRVVHHLRAGGWADAAAQAGVGAQAVETVVAVAFLHAGVGVALGGQVAQAVVAVGLLKDAACSLAIDLSLDVLEAPGGLVKLLDGGDAPALAVTGQAALAVVFEVVKLRARHAAAAAIDGLQVAQGAVAVAGVVAGGPGLAVHSAGVGVIAHADLALALAAVLPSTGAVETDQAVVAMGAPVAVVGPGLTQLAHGFVAAGITVDVSVVVPGAFEVRLVFGGHAPQRVVAHGADLAQAVCLAHELAKGVVGVAPHAHGGVVHANLAAPLVVAQGGEHPRCSTGLRTGKYESISSTQRRPDQREIKHPLQTDGRASIDTSCRGPVAL